MDKSKMDKWIDNSIKVLEAYEAQLRKKPMSDCVAELKRSEPEVVCNPELFLARPLYGPPLLMDRPNTISTSSEKKMDTDTPPFDAKESAKSNVDSTKKPLSDIEKLRRSEQKVFCDPALFLARPLYGPPLVAAASGDDKKNEESDKYKKDRNVHLEDNVDAVAEYIISISQHAPVGALDQLSEPDDKKILPATEFKIPLTRTFSTVTLGKNLTVPVQLYSTNSAPIRSAINSYDRYGYLNTSRKEIKIWPEPIYETIEGQRRIKNVLIRDDEQNNKVSELMDFDELPSQRTPIWTPISDLVSECHDIAVNQVDETLNQEIIEPPVIPCDFVKNYRETIADYIKSLENTQPNKDHEEMVEKMKNKGIEQRIRRKLEEGSYSNYSVNEKKLYGNKDTILRLTWKGKLPKLQKLLHDKRSHEFINRQDYCGRTALHFAASWNCPQTMKLLLAVPGIDVNLQDADGKTALRKACEIKSLSGVKLLIEFGANALIAANDNRNPFEYTIQEQGDDGFDIAKYLYHDAELNCEKKEIGIVSHLHRLCLSKVKVTRLARELILSGANINATEGNGRTPLIVAAQMNRAELVEVFLVHKADVMVTDFENNRALTYATPGRACTDIMLAMQVYVDKQWDAKQERVPITQRVVSPTRRRL